MFDNSVDAFSCVLFYCCFAAGGFMMFLIDYGLLFAVCFGW